MGVELSNFECRMEILQNEGLCSTTTTNPYAPRLHLGRWSDLVEPHLLIWGREEPLFDGREGWGVKLGKDTRIAGKKGGFVSKVNLG